MVFENETILVDQLERLLRLESGVRGLDFVGMENAGTGFKHFFQVIVGERPFFGFCSRLGVVIEPEELRICS